MRALWILAVTACYEPELRDCAVTCGASTECADDQVCDGDGFCAAPDVAGSCAGEGPAPTTVALRVKIDGPGQVQAIGYGTCTLDCTWQVVVGASVQLVAIENQKPFERWRTSSCVGQPATCTLAMTAATIATAKFH